MPEHNQQSEAGIFEYMSIEVTEISSNLFAFNTERFIPDILCTNDTDTEKSLELTAAFKAGNATKNSNGMHPSTFALRDHG